jgi:hypothetical protein
MCIGNLLGRYAHRKVFLKPLNLEISVMALVAFNFLPRNFLVVVSCSGRYTSVPAHSNLPEVYFLPILIALHRLL